MALFFSCSSSQGSLPGVAVAWWNSCLLCWGQGALNSCMLSIDRRNQSFLSGLSLEQVQGFASVRVDLRNNPGDAV